MDSTIADFLDSLRARGIDAWREPPRIVTFRPARLLTDEDKDFIATHSRELLAILPERSAPNVTPSPEREASSSESGHRRLAESDERDRPEVSGYPPAVAPPRTAPRLAPRTAPTRPAESAPTLTVRGYGRITEQDVLEALENLGDVAVADYRSGRLSKAEAYAMAADRVRAYLQMGARRIGQFWI